jgi:hypothetical protein
MQATASSKRFRAEWLPTLFAGDHKQSLVHSCDDERNQNFSALRSLASRVDQWGQSAANPGVFSLLGRAR